MDYNKESLKIHRKLKGKLSVESKVRVENKEDLSIAYTPGVAEPCRKINQNKDDVYKYTIKGNTVAVVSDGSAVLGLGNIGPEAAMPVMEGKALLFKSFANVDAFPICLDTQEVDEIIKTVTYLAPTFGGINLEDISAPRCIEIEEKLRQKLDIPVFHDDQHGTAIVVSAAVLNALKLSNKEISKIDVVINGAGAAGSAIMKMLLCLGVKNIYICDRKGIIQKGREGVKGYKEKLAELTAGNKTGNLESALIGADVFIGVSAADVLNGEMIRKMNVDPIIFAMANPVPEIMPDVAIDNGAFIIGTGRSDFPNQINNVLAFPGIFRGALDARASDINDEMKLAAVYALANMVGKEQLSKEYILPKAFEEGVAKKVAEAVYNAAVKTGVSRI